MHPRHQQSLITDLLVIKQQRTTTRIMITNITTTIIRLENPIYRMIVLIQRDIIALLWKPRIVMNPIVSDQTTSFGISRSLPRLTANIFRSNRPSLMIRIRSQHG